jgi:hypothetical protein
MNHDIAKGEFGVVSIRHPTDGSASSRMMMHQYTFQEKRRHKNQQELGLYPTTCNMIGVKELPKIKNNEPMVMVMTVFVEQNVEVKNKRETEYAEIHLFLSPFTLSWLDALISLFLQLPSEKRKVKADIAYQDILNRNKEDRKQEKTNTQVMGDSAVNVFRNFMKDQPVHLTKDKLDMVAPNWCHIIMGSALTSEKAQVETNLCCAPEGLNTAMHVPEHMVARLAKHLDSSHRSVHVSVKLELVAGTSILKSMKYKIKTDDVKISVAFDHPFQQPHFNFQQQGVLHLSDIMRVKL